MTIRRGEPWGEQVESPDDLPVVENDAAARAVLLSHLELGTRPLQMGLAGGDLAHTLGGGAAGRFPGQVVRAPIDVLRVEADGQTTWAVAHVVARGWWWRGEVVLAMNAQFLGKYDVAPRSHPNDGRVDMLHIDPSMRVRTRLAVRRRARRGNHLPHPLIDARQTPGATVRFVRPLTIRVDGVRWLRTRELTVTVEPDALIAHA